MPIYVSYLSLADCVQLFDQFTEEGVWVGLGTIRPVVFLQSHSARPRVERGEEAAQGEMSGEKAREEV